MARTVVLPQGIPERKEYKYVLTLLRQSYTAEGPPVYLNVAPGLWRLCEMLVGPRPRVL